VRASCSSPPPTQTQVDSLPLTQTQVDSLDAAANERLAATFMQMGPSDRTGAWSDGANESGKCGPTTAGTEIGRSRGRISRRLRSTDRVQPWRDGSDGSGGRRFALDAGAAMKPPGAGREHRVLAEEPLRASFGIGDVKGAHA
jgi:hypothetical protein